MRELERQLLSLLEDLSAMVPAPVEVVLSQCADGIASMLAAEKVDAFLYEQASQSLVAVGTSRTELAHLQKSLGLDRLALANADPMARVFESGVPYRLGRIDQDPTQPRGVVEQLKVRSMLGVALHIGGSRRGVLSVASKRNDAFTEDDLSSLKIVAVWVGSLVHRSELLSANAERASEHARRATAEELITTVAHDLRNLLQPVTARAMVMQERAMLAGRESDAQQCQLLLTGLDRVSRLMGDLLDVTRIERDLLALVPEQCDLLELVHSIAQTLSLPGVPIEVDCRLPALPISADRRRLAQALENVLSNATKHSPRGVPVAVIVEKAQRQEGDVAKISIVDRGPGIPPELLPSVFERYVSSGRSAGLGLGLYLARALIAAHGGEITLHSRPGEGTSCEVLLPIHAGAAETP